MTTVTGVVKTAAKKPDRSKWIFTSQLRKSGDDDSIVSTTINVVTPNVDGVLTVELDPGPVIVKYGNTTVTVMVPDVVDSFDLWDLIGTAVNLPPVTTDQKLIDAFSVFMNMRLAMAISRPTAVKTAAYNALAGDFVPADATAGGFTVTLPADPPDGTPVLVKKIDDTDNPVTVQRSGLDVFNQVGGPSTLQLVIPEQTVWLQYKNGIWYVLSHGIPFVALTERFVDFDSPQALEQKTLVAPKIAIISDANGNEGLQIDATANAVNFLRAVNSATNQAVTLRTAGDDANIGMLWRPKGTGVISILDGSGLLVAEFTTVASAVNYWRLTSSAANGALTARAIGADTDIGINLITKGAGKAQANGNELVTVTGAQVIKDKALWVDSLKDTNGNTAVLIDAIASAVNYLRIVPAAATGVALLRAAGADTDVSMGVRPQGSGEFTVFDGAGNRIARFSTLTAPTSYLRITTGKGTTPGSIAILGTDVTAGFDLPGKWMSNGIDLATHTPASAASGSTLTPDAAKATMWARTAQAVNLTVNAPTGTPIDGKAYTFRIKDDGTSRTLTWNAIYRAIGVTLPAATTAGKTLYVFCCYNAADAKMDVIDVKQEA